MFLLLVAGCSPVIACAIECVHWTALEPAWMDMHRSEECGESLETLRRALVAAGIIDEQGKRIAAAIRAAKEKPNGP